MSDAITGLSSMATKHVLADLAARYEQRAGRRVSIQSMGGVEAAKRVRAGEPADIVVLTAAVMEKLEAEGHLFAGSCVDFVRSGIAVAVAADAPAFAIDNEDALRAATLAARKVGYSSGPSGDHLKALWQRWAIADEMATRAVQAPPGVPVASLVAKGDVDLGFQQLSELLDQPGIKILGALPAAIQAITVFTAGIAKAAARPDDAHALIAYLASPETTDTKRCRGLEPAGGAAVMPP